MSSRGHTKINLIILSSVSLLSLTTIAGLILISNKVSAESPAKSNASVTVPEACTMTSTNDTPHTAIIMPNTYSGASGSGYENGIGKTTLTTICNDSNGFAIYAIGYTGNSYDSNDHTKLVGSNTGHSINTAVYTNNATPSNWSMKVTKVTNSSESYNPQNMSILDSFDSWHIVPANYTKVAQYHASTGSSVTDATLGAKIETTYAAFIAPNQPADTYVGQVKYTMVHPYDAAAPEGPMGLCRDSDTCMQQQTTASLAQKLPNVGDTTTLYDARDDQAYTVAKLADGKYWMTENLNIAGGTALSSEDTDLDSSYTLPTNNGWTVTDGKLVLPASSTSGFSTDKYAYVYNSGNRTSNCSSTGCYSYYSWDVATLGSGRSISTDNTDAEQSICPKNWRLPTSRNTSTFDATTAVNSDFYNLATNYGMPTGAWSQSTGNFYSQAGPGTISNFLLGGSYYGGSFYNGGSYGFYWSSTSSSTSSLARNLRFNSGRVDSANSNGRGSGYSVRCLFGS